MSQHGFQETLQASLRPEGTMDLFIETLTGTAFEMTVSPFDTIMSIKSKIQKVEGIPVSHQHLIYNMQELDDSLCLLDYSIQNGATLKLVLSMRGGPISTRRLPSGEEFAWKELREFVETNREDMFENLPPGCRVTVLVFRDGDQVNLFRVIENEDGTYSPLSDSWSGSSIRNLFAEEDPDEAARRLQENSITMSKMQELKSRMEQLAIHRKPKQSIPLSTVTYTKHPSQHLCKESPQLLVNQRPASPESHDHVRSRSQQNFFHLPPIQRTETIPAVPTRSQQSLANRGSLLNPLHQPISRRSREVQNKVGRREINLNPESQRNRICKRDLKDSHKQPSLPLVIPKPEIHANGRRSGRILSSTFPDMKPQRCVEYGAARSIRRSDTERELKPLINDGESLNNCTNVLSTSNIAIVEEESDSTIEKEEPDFPSSPSPIPIPSKEPTTFTVSQIPRERVTSAVGSGNVYRVSRFVLDEDDRPKTSPDKLPQHKTQEICDLLSEANWRRHRHQPLCNTPMDILRGVPRTADGEFASGTHLRNKQSLERSRVDLTLPVESSLLDVSIRSPRYGRRSIILPSNGLDSNHERSKSGTSPLMRQEITFGARHLRQARPRVPFLNQGSVLLQSDKILTTQEPIHPPPILPPVKKAAVRSRCAACRKKLNITNQYTCRCEKLFCSAHRYSELHDCSFDYKSEGRKLLEQANPLVTAPKLPKI